MSRLALLPSLIEAARRPERVGDLAVIKAEFLGVAPASPEAVARLREMGPLPDVAPEPLRALPKGTLGREYIDLLDANGLRPFRLSAAVDPVVVEHQAFIARYALVHDIFHVLTGFDTSWAGELGVWAFVEAQGYDPTHKRAVAMARVLYPLLAPRQIPELRRALRHGREAGRRASKLLYVHYERRFAEPVEALRAELDVMPYPQRSL